MGSCISCRVSDGRKEQRIPEILPARPVSKEGNKTQYSERISIEKDADSHNNSITVPDEDVFDANASFSSLNNPRKHISGRQKKLSICSTYSGRTGLDIPQGIPEDNVLTVHDLYNILNDGSFNAFIHEEGNFLLIDCRDLEAYQKLHIMSAKHENELKNATFQSGLGYSMFNLMIIYGTSLKYDAQKNLQALWAEISRNFAGEVLILLDGFDAFYGMFPFMCSDVAITNVWQRRSIVTYPSAVINDKLYQGKGEQATNKRIIDDLKITHIVNITKEHPNKFADDVTYLRLALEDEKGTNLLKYFEETCSFIEKALKKKGIVLVHCNLGVSRSSTVTLAYLMKSQLITLESAITFLKSRRSCIRPNIGFLSQLSEWELKLLGKKITDVYSV